MVAHPEPLQIRQLRSRDEMRRIASEHLTKSGLLQIDMAQNEIQMFLKGTRGRGCREIVKFARPGPSDASNTREEGFYEIKGDRTSVVRHFAGPPAILIA